MITMVLIASAALMLTFGLMRSTASRSLGARRDQGIRWRGIDWSQADSDKAEDQLRKTQD